MATLGEPPPGLRPWREVLKEVETVEADMQQRPAPVIGEAGKFTLPTGEQAIPLATLGPVQRALVEEPAGFRQVNAETTQQLIAEVIETTEMEDETYGEDRHWYGTDVVNVTKVVTFNTGSTATTKRLIWKLWNDQHWNSSTSATTVGYQLLDNDVWDNWTTGWHKVRRNYNDEMWSGWVDKKDKHRDDEYRRRYGRTQEEQIAWELRQKEAAERAEIERKARVLQLEGAKVKAEKLLLSALDDSQKHELKGKGYFHCKSRKGVVYRIYKGTHGNVKRLDDRGKEVESLCIQPDNVPDFDAMLAQKLHIEFNEDDFRKTANITRLN